MKNLKLNIVAYIILGLVFVFALVLIIINGCQTRSDMPEETSEITTEPLCVETAVALEPKYCSFEYVGEYDLSTAQGMELVNELTPIFGMIYHVYDVKCTFDDESTYDHNIVFVTYTELENVLKIDSSYKTQVAIYDRTIGKVLADKFNNIIRPYLMVFDRDDNTQHPLSWYWRNNQMYICVCIRVIDVSRNASLEKWNYYLFSLNYDVNEVVPTNTYYVRDYYATIVKMEEYGSGMRPVEEQPLT